MNWSTTTKSPGAQILAQAADGGERDDVGDAAAFQRVDVGAEIDLGRRQHVPAAVARHEHHRVAVERAEAEFVRGRAERAVDPAPGDIGEAVDLVEAAAADDADDRWRDGAKPLIAGSVDHRPDLALGGVEHADGHDQKQQHLDPGAMTGIEVRLRRPG